MCVCPSREGKRICTPVSRSEDFASIFLDGGGQGVRVSVLFGVLFICPCWGNGESLPSCGSVPLDNLSVISFESSPESVSIPVWKGEAFCSSLRGSPRLFPLKVHWSLFRVGLVGPCPSGDVCLL